MDRSSIKTVHVKTPRYANLRLVVDNEMMTTVVMRLEEKLVKEALTMKRLYSQYPNHTNRKAEMKLVKILKFNSKLNVKKKS